MDLIVAVIEIIVTYLSNIQGFKKNNDKNLIITITNNMNVYNKSSEK